MTESRTIKPLIGLVFTLAALLLTACSKAPPCNYSGSETAEANTGCLAIHQNKILIIEGKNGLFQTPGGGTTKGEVAQCTAERETWEETGIEVEAKELIVTFDNGFKLFDCNVKDNQILDGSNRPWRLEVSGVHWLGPNDFGNKEWRFPEQVERIKLHLQNSLK